MTALPCHLDELDREEWRAVMRKLCPDLDDGEFDRAWAEFQRLKALRAMQ